MNKKVYIISLVIILIDQFLKLLVSYFNVNISIIPNFLSLIITSNKGVAFSMLSGHNILIIVVSVILLIVLINMYNKEIKSENKTKYKQVIFGILFGGIMGNLIDRIFKGKVIDYISIEFNKYYFPIFNFADIAITIGVILLIILIVKEEDKN